MKKLTEHQHQQAKALYKIEVIEEILGDIQHIPGEIHELPFGEYVTVCDLVYKWKKSLREAIA